MVQMSDLFFILVYSVTDCCSQYFMLCESALLNGGLANRGVYKGAPSGRVWLGYPWGYDEGVTVSLEGIICRLSISTISDFVDT